MDLLKIGKYGVKNAQTLLNSTSNNISNVSTTGYTRRTTNTYTSVVDWGVGDTVTTRAYDIFVQRQMYADQGTYKYYEAYKSGMEGTDSMLSSTEMGMSTSFNSFFDSLSDAVQNPTSVGTREEVLSEMKIMVNRFNTLNDAMLDEITTTNDRVRDDISTLNEDLKQLSNVNRQIYAFAHSETVQIAGSIENESYLELLDLRDNLINQISEFVDTSVVTNNDGTYTVYMQNGQLLANAESYAEFSVTENELDASRLDVSLSFNHYAGTKTDNTTVLLGYDKFGGSIGGYLNATNEIRQSMRDLGQLAVAFMDAVNVQNQAGITLDGTSGQELFTMTPATVMGVATVSGEAVTASFNRTEGSNYPNCDFYISCRAAGSYEIYTVDAQGTKTLVDPADYTQNGNDINLEKFGITLTFNNNPTALTGAFLVQPTKMAASNIEVNANKAEDIALASAVVTNTDENNKGSGVISLTSMDYTGANMAVSISATSAPSFNTMAPTYIEIADNGDYQIYDQQGGTLLATAPASTDGKNLFANCTPTGATGNPFNAGVDGYPGFEITISGLVEPGDSFSIAINENPDLDNSNGVKLAALRTADRVSTNYNSSSKGTFTEAYADMTSALGAAVLGADTDLEAAQTKYTQTKNTYESTAGVNLDEEAANLLLYQQTYTSCAKIIQASQTVFDSLISAF